MISFKKKAKALRMKYDQKPLSQLLSFVEAALRKPSSETGVRLVRLSYLPAGEAGSGSMDGKGVSNALNGTPKNGVPSFRALLSPLLTAPPLPRLVGGSASPGGLQSALYS